ncbi:uncharacterized protein LOC141660008 [Apium graveolens]|uniref:uncharacterized protein LOC141660008 n=1 Tax=Apium graveolens TaxID=4045 RepID=UPI003D7A385C
MANQNLEQLYSRLTLEEEDVGGIVVGNEEVRPNKKTFMLIGRLLTEKNVNFTAMQNVLASLWRPKEVVEIHNLGAQRYSFVFYHILDLQKVLDGGPWTFEQSLLIYHQLKEGENPQAVDLNKVEMWVQIYDLPTGFVSDRILQSIGNYVGTFVKEDPANSNGA